MADQTTSKDIDQNRSIAALSYVWALFLIPMLIKRDSKFCQFHAKQGLILFLGEIIAAYVWFLWFPLGILAIIGFIQAMTGKYYRLPLIADLAEKFNF